MDGSGSVLGRCVDGIQLKRHMTCVNYVMPCSGRYDNGVIRVNPSLEAQIIGPVTHKYHSLALLDAYELVKIRMDFKANVFAYINAVQRNLQVVPGPDGNPESAVAFYGHPLY